MSADDRELAQSMTSFQKSLDEQTRCRLSSSPIQQQETLADFILSAASMASDLRQVCTIRRQADYQLDSVEELAEYMTKKILDHFRSCFGRPLFDEIPPSYNGL